MLTPTGSNRHVRHTLQGLLLEEKLAKISDFRLMRRPAQEPSAPTPHPSALAGCHLPLKGKAFVGQFAVIACMEV